jgi:hypothetical protein
VALIRQSGQLAPGLKALVRSVDGVVDDRQGFFRQSIPGGVRLGAPGRGC